jgi:hypothetical protein
MAFGEGVKRGFRRAKAAVVKDRRGCMRHARARRQGEAQTSAAHTISS